MLEAAFDVVGLRQVAVARHEKQETAFGSLRSGVVRAGGPAVLRMKDRVDAVAERSEDFARRVFRAVVDDDDLDVRVGLVEDRFDSAADRPFAVEDRDHHRDQCLCVRHECSESRVNPRFSHTGAGFQAHGGLDFRDV